MSSELHVLVAQDPIRKHLFVEFDRELMLDSCSFRCLFGGVGHSKDDVLRSLFVFYRVVIGCTGLRG